MPTASPRKEGSKAGRLTGQSCNGKGLKSPEEGESPGLGAQGEEKAGFRSASAARAVSD